MLGARRLSSGDDAWGGKLAVYDLITVGRVTMDLFARDIGAAFEDVTGFDASVGGSPTNIAIGTTRLGLRTIAFTAVGDDLVGDFVLRTLRDEGVVTDYLPRKAGKMTSLALLGAQPPDHFPLSFHRDDPADIHLTIDDALRLPISDTRAVQLSGNAFSRGTCVGAARLVAESARHHALASFMDLDLRPTEWPHPRVFGLTLRSVMPLVEVIIGTEEEFHAALAPHPDVAMARGSVSEEEQTNLEHHIADLIDRFGVTVVLKRGARGVSIVTPEERHEIAGFPVEVVNTVGAGDAFASGLIGSRLAGWDWERAGRYANACGAIEVTRHGCSAALPTDAEVMSLFSTVPDNPHRDA
jgi:5-dehydro-2-deoxygluconokinase